MILITMKRRTGDDRNSYARRERDMDRMAWIRSQPCCVARRFGDRDELWRGPEPDACQRHVEAHHAGGYDTGKALSNKADDDTAIPICDHHHDALTDARGCFSGWPPLSLRAWQDAKIAKYQRLYAEYQRSAEDGLW